MQEEQRQSSERIHRPLRWARFVVMTITSSVTRRMRPTGNIRTPIVAGQERLKSEIQSRATSARPPKNRMEPAQRRKRAEISLSPLYWLPRISRTGWTAKPSWSSMRQRSLGMSATCWVSFCQGAEDSAGGSGGGRAVQIVRRDGLAGVEDRVLAGGHALVPALWLRVGVKEQQRA